MKGGAVKGGAVKEPPLVNKQTVCILLECILVCREFKPNCGKIAS